MRQYIILKKNGYGSMDTAPVYRSDNKEEWLEMIQEFAKKHKLNNINSRIEIHDNYSVFVFCVASQIAPFWELTYYKKPLIQKAF